jgi:hypothetical protein
MSETSEKTLKGLELLNTWTNVLIVTTTAAVGWLVEKSLVNLGTTLGKAVLACFCLSIVCGILAMCQIPGLAARVDDDTRSIYELRGDNYLFPFWRVSFPVIWVLWPQHTLFIAGIVLLLWAKV